jgi:hypothetical protein
VFHLLLSSATLLLTSPPLNNHYTNTMGILARTKKRLQHKLRTDPWDHGTPIYYGDAIDQLNTSTVPAPTPAQEEPQDPQTSHQAPRRQSRYSIFIPASLSRNNASNRTDDETSRSAGRRTSAIEIDSGTRDRTVTASGDQSSRRNSSAVHAGLGEARAGPCANANLSALSALEGTARPSFGGERSASESSGSTTVSRPERTPMTDARPSRRPFTVTRPV